MSLDFSGSAGTYAGNNAAFNFGTTQDFTIEFKMKTTMATVGCLFEQRAADGTGYSMFTQANGTVRVRIQAPLGVNAYVNTVAAVNTGVEKHISVSVDRDGNMIIYIDGAYSNQVSVTSVGNISNSAYLAFGRAQSLFLQEQSEYNYDGELSDFRMWDIVRTPTQISDNVDAVLQGNETNLIGLWLANETSGAVMNSQFSEAHDAPVYGTYAWQFDPFTTGVVHSGNGYADYDIACYRRSDGALAGTTTSNSEDGTYTVDCLDDTEHCLVAVKDVNTVQVIDRVLPTAP